MLDNPFRNKPEGLNPDDEAFLEEFAGLDNAGNTVEPAPTTEEEEIPAEVAVSLGATSEQKEDYWNTLVDIAPGFKIPRREYEAVVELFKRINEDVPEVKRILIEDSVGGERSFQRIRIKDNHVIFLNFEDTLIQSLDGVTLPEELQILALSYCNQLQSLDGVILPKGLMEFGLKGTSINSLAGVILPQSLQYLDLSGTLIQSLDMVALPEGMQRVHLYGTTLSQDRQKMLELKAKYPNIEFKY